MAALGTATSIRKKVWKTAGYGRNDTGFDWNFTLHNVNAAEVEEMIGAIGQVQLVADKSIDHRARLLGYRSRYRRWVLQQQTRWENFLRFDLLAPYFGRKAQYFNRASGAMVLTTSGDPVIACIPVCFFLFENVIAPGAIETKLQIR